MMKGAVFVALTLALAVSALKPTAFPGRSGNVVIEPLVAQSRGAQMCLFDHSKQWFVETEQATAAAAAVPATSLASAVSRAFNILPPNQDAVNFVHTDVFSQPAANLLITVDNADASVLLAPLRKTASVCREVEEGFYPNTALPLAATLSTGALPAKHGIVGAAWPDAKNHEVRAYSDISAWSHRASLADVMAQANDGLANIVSLSSDAQLAAAFGVSPMLASSLQANAYTVSFTGKSWTCGAARVGCPLAQEVAVDEIAAAVKADHAHVFAAIGATVEGTTVKAVKLEATFDLTIPAHFQLFSEVVYATEVLPKALRNFKHTVADFVTISFAGLQNLEKSEYSAGAVLVGAAVRAVMKEMSAIYRDGFVAEVVLLGRAISSPTDDKAVAAIVAALPEMDEKSVAHYLPALYVSDANLKFACATLPAKLEELKLTAVCPSVEAMVLAAASSPSASPVRLQSGGGNAGTDFIPSQYGHGVQIYQITMWTAIMLVVILAMGVYALFYMDFKKDTLLYGSFNPNWEDRKRR